MRKQCVLFFFLACVGLSLAACGGSSGSSSAAGPDGFGPATIIASIAGDLTPQANLLNSASSPAEVAAKVMPDGLAAEMEALAGLSLNSDVTIKAGSIELTYKSSGGEYSARFENNQIKFYDYEGINFIIGAIAKDTNFSAAEPLKDNGATFYGKITTNDTLALAQMDYSIFGYWAHDLRATGTGTQGSSTVTLENFFIERWSDVQWSDVQTFATGLPEFEKDPQYSIGGNNTFKGLVAGIAYNVTGEETEVFYLPGGTAELALISPTAGKLTLDFPKFATLKADNLKIGTVGKISGAFTSYYTGSTGTRPLDGIQSSRNTISGQFYGDKDLSVATEAAGTFQLITNDDSMGIMGSFGVKQ